MIDHSKKKHVSKQNKFYGQDKLTVAVKKQIFIVDLSDFFYNKDGIFELVPYSNSFIGLNYRLKGHVVSKTFTWKQFQLQKNYILLSKL